jgi:hypothetical protein
MVWRGHSPDETLKHGVEAVLGFCAAHFRHLRLRADDQFQVGDDVDQNLAILTNGLKDRGSPLVNIGFTFNHPTVDQPVKACTQAV